MTEEQKLELREILNYKYNDKELKQIDNKFRGYYKYAEDFYNNGEKREDHEHIEGKNGIYIFSI